jgi:hypothetical protein
LPRLLLLVQLQEHHSNREEHAPRRRKRRGALVVVVLELANGAVELEAEVEQAEVQVDEGVESLPTLVIQGTEMMEIKGRTLTMRTRMNQRSVLRNSSSFVYPLERCAIGSERR